MTVRTADTTRLGIDVALHYVADAPCDAMLSLEVADAPDQAIVHTSLTGMMGNSLRRIEAEEGIGHRVWLTLQEKLECTYSAEVVITRPLVKLASLPQAVLTGLPADVVKYLMPSRYCDGAAFQDFCSTEFSGLSGGAFIAACEQWIMANLEYVAGSSGPHTTAEDTFLQRQGVCRDYAHVLIAMARAVAIPARIVSVYAPEVTPPDFHAVAQVYLDDAWYLVDATGMAEPSDMAIISVGRDAADISFLTSYGNVTLQNQSVSVRRL